jgi:hypothetical protein
MQARHLLSLRVTPSNLASQASVASAANRTAQLFSPFIPPPRQLGVNTVNEQNVTGSHGSRADLMKMAAKAAWRRFELLKPRRVEITSIHQTQGRALLKGWRHHPWRRRGEKKLIYELRMAARPAGATAGAKGLAMTSSVFRRMSPRRVAIIARTI